MLPALTNPPDSPESWQQFSFANRTSHDAIRSAVLAKGGPNLADLVLDPIDFNDFGNWLLRHALTHEQMDSALGLQSADLTVLDPNDPQAVAGWTAIHSLEHLNAEQVSRAVD